MLFLDEPPSNLDPQQAGNVFDLLARLDMTRIVITHHPEQLKKVDNILVMDKGQLVESGTYDELLSAPDGLFKKMMAST